MNGNVNKRQEERARGSIRYSERGPRLRGAVNVDFSRRCPIISLFPGDDSVARPSAVFKGIFRSSLAEAPAPFVGGEEIVGWEFVSAQSKARYLCSSSYLQSGGKFKRLLWRSQTALFPPL